MIGRANSPGLGGGCFDDVVGCRIFRHEPYVRKVPHVPGAKGAREKPDFIVTNQNPIQVLQNGKWFSSSHCVIGPSIVVTDRPCRSNEELAFRHTISDLLFGAVAAVTSLSEAP